MNGKMAYLILAHKNDITFRTLCRMLDDERNDLYIHMDSKVRDYDEKEVQTLVKKSAVYHCRRTNVTWGGASMIRAELLLLKEATARGCYSRYHLLSGEDLPLRSNDEIYRFFQAHCSEEFVDIMSPEFAQGHLVHYRYRFQEKAGREENFFQKLQRTDVRLQKFFRYQRNLDIAFQKGANWFSITDALARYVVSREDWVREVFRDTVCCDEIFLQTLVINSEFADRLYSLKCDNKSSSIARKIDWTRGTPYVFRSPDLPELLESDCCFARKFQAEVDEEVIRQLYRTVKGEDL